MGTVIYLIDQKVAFHKGAYKLLQYGVVIQDGRTKEEVYIPWHKVDQIIVPKGTYFKDEVLKDKTNLS